VNTTTRAGFGQPALLGGAVLGVLSSLPIIAAGNLCCCLWVVCGGAVAAYVLQQNQPTPITPGDGALAGLLAGVSGAFIYLLLSIPITMVMSPMERVMMERIIESGRVPPEFRQYLGTYAGGFVQLAVGFFFMLVIGSLFATVGGVIGAALFRKQPPPGTAGPAGPPGIPGIVDSPGPPPGTA
jgi:hypothetical protein